MSPAMAATSVMWLSSRATRSPRVEHQRPPLLGERAGQRETEAA
jgi:hypothetical protein